MTARPTIAARRHDFAAWLRTDDHLAALIIAIFCAMLLAMRQDYRVPLTTGLPPARVAACVGLLMLLVGVAAGRPYWTRAVREIPVFPVVAALGVAAATFASAAYATTGSMNPTSMMLSGYALRDAVTVLAAFVVIVALVRTVESIVLVLRGLVVGATVSALAGLVNYVAGVDLAPLITLPGLKFGDETLVTNLMRDGVVRPQGSAGHPLELSSVLTILLPVAVALAFEAHRRGVRWWPWAGAAMILIAGAASTVSRSALVGMGVAAVVFAAYWPIRRSMRVFAAAVVAVGLLWLINVPILRTLIDVVTRGSKDASLQSRSIGRDYVAEQVGHHIWLGQGAGTYDVRVQPVLDNDYLSQLMQLGLVGVAALIVFYLAGLGSGLVAAVRLRRADSPAAELAPGLLAAVAIVAVIGTILDIGGFAQVSMLFTALVALSVCLLRASRESVSTPSVDLGDDDRHRVTTAV